MQATFQYQAFFLMLFIPFFSLAYRWIYRKQRLNFAERYLVVMVGMNKSNIISCVVLYPLFYFFPELDFISLSMLGLVWALFLTFHQFSGQSSILKSIVSSLLVLAIGYVLFLLIVAIGVVGWFVMKTSMGL